MKKINKLIRDKIPEINDKNWTSYKVKYENWDKLEKRFFDKMQEELEEIKIWKNIEEIADLQEVLIWYSNFKWFSFADIEKYRKEKYKKLWWFENWTILLETAYFD